MLRAPILSRRLLRFGASTTPLGATFGVSRLRLPVFRAQAFSSGPLLLEKKKGKGKESDAEKESNKVGKAEAEASSEAAEASEAAAEVDESAASAGEPAAGAAVGSAAADSAGSGDAASSGADSAGPVDPADSTGPNGASIYRPPLDYPNVLAIPLAARPLFPGTYRLFTIKDPAVIAAVDESIKLGQEYVGVFLLREGDGQSDTIETAESVYDVGTFCQIVKVTRGERPEDGVTIMAYPQRRLQLSEIQNVGPDAPGELSDDTQFLNAHRVSVATVSNIELADTPDPETVRALASEVIATLKKLNDTDQTFMSQLNNYMLTQPSINVLQEPERLVDMAASVSRGGTAELQLVLASTSLEERLKLILTILKKELLDYQLRRKVYAKVEEKITKRNAEYYLNEQLKRIKQELGNESDAKDKALARFVERANALDMPDDARAAFEEEITRLQQMESSGGEYNVVRNYIEWLTSLPWGIHTREKLNLQHARAVLDRDHYGLTDVKDRVLEFLAVAKLRGTIEGKILCFVGPPGVGKTSIAKSIAQSIGRHYYRISVGGLGDVAEIKGHRRTYIGAMPGKMVQALKTVQSSNPFILIDEIDKLGHGGHHGDPSSALLEMLDPEQNSSFMDHYLDVPLDLSKVLFVCTANSLDTIPAPLLDRMEVIQVSSYNTEEKVNIATQYLAPAAKKSAGLANAAVTIAPEAITDLIKYYCRESGVRQLKQRLEKIYRKTAFNIVKDLPEETSETTSEEIEIIRNAPKKQSAIQVEKERTVVEELLSVYEEDAGEEAGEKSAEAAKDATEDVTPAPLQVPENVKIEITQADLATFLGPPTWQKERLYIEKSPIGVSCGLGWLGNGSGSLMPIEVTAMPGGGGNVQLTGKLGDVIKESARIALSYIRANAFRLGLIDDADTDLTEKRTIHLHMPEGAIGKDGPSAGIAILCAYLSLFTKTGIRSDLAMTGEVSLAGQVLPVGGLKEKILASHRAGIKKLIVPEACRADIEFNVPDSVKEGIDIVYVETVGAVIAECFGEDSEIAKKAADLEKEMFLKE